MKRVEIRYARSGDVSIAYQVVGQGSFDLVFVPGFISNLELHWEDPGYSHLLRRLSAFSRLILFDKRGTGLSDRIDAQHLPSLETRMDDVRAVMDASGSGRAVLLGASEGAPMAILFAATYPERVRALVLYGAYAHFPGSVMGPERLDQFLESTENRWGTGATLKHFAPGRVDDPHFREWWGRFERLSATPTGATTLARMNAAIDVRDVLPAVNAPTLVVHRRDDARVSPECGRYLAAHIQDARMVELAGRDHPIWTGDVDGVADAIEQFLTGERSSHTGDRILATLLALRIPGAERMAVRHGDREWRERLEALRQRMETVLARNGGRFATWENDRMTARFDGPARAAACALALRGAAGAIEIRVAQAVHIGEIEIREHQVAGLALHIAERIAASAGPGEILVSAVVADLAAGSGLHFAGHGTIPVEGMDRPLVLLALATEQHLEPSARKRQQPKAAPLSSREREVLALVADGGSNPTIASALGLSEHTVKRHVANILLKLDLPTRAAAAAFAARQPAS